MIDSLTSISAAGAVDRGLSTEPAPVAVNRSSSGMRAADRTLLCVKIIEVVGGRKMELDGDYHFEQLPALNDQIVVRNRRRAYDILRVSRTAHEGGITVYVRWVAGR